MQLATNWDTHVCFRELPVWVDAAKQDRKLHFLTPGSRLLLNSSQPESCITDNYVLPGYQAISGEWVMLTPGLQLLRSPPEAVLTQAASREGSAEKGSQVGTYQAGTLFRWAEYQQYQFRQWLIEQNLGPYALSLIRGHQLQISSMTQEYCEFLWALGPIRDRAHPPGTSFFQKACGWFIIIGNCCSLLLVCWIFSKLWYNSTKVIRSLKQ